MTDYEPPPWRDRVVLVFDTLTAKGVPKAKHLWGPFTYDEAIQFVEEAGLKAAEVQIMELQR